jgi:hypothetical protein
MSAEPTDNQTAEVLKPPAASVGVLGWLRTNLFSTWYNSLLTIAVIYLLWISVPPFIRWAFVDSFWTASGKVCLEADSGACWSIIPHNIRFIMFGFYPTRSSGGPDWPWSFSWGFWFSASSAVTGRSRCSTIGWRASSSWAF